MIVSDYLPRISALQSERAAIWARDATGPGDAARLAELESQLAYLWRLRRAEQAGACAIAVPRKLAPIGYEAVGVRRRRP